MELGFTNAAYVVAGVARLCSSCRWAGLSLSGKRQARDLVRHRRHGRSCRAGATLVGPGAGLWWLSDHPDRPGAVPSAIVLATRVQMTQMPELVAAMHSLVGLAAVFVGLNAHIEIGRVATDASRGWARAFPRPCDDRPRSRRRRRAALVADSSAASAARSPRRSPWKSRSCGSSCSSASSSARSPSPAPSSPMASWPGVQDRHLGRQAAARRAHAERRGRSGRLAVLCLICSWRPAGTASGWS